jgi:1-acyl-sn-glycerol-3-phosphate acyltransferase
MIRTHQGKMESTEICRRLVPEAISWALTRFTRLVTGAQARWIGCAPVPVQRVYFGNHNSHADFALIWASLPAELRRVTRPVAGADYWNASAIKRYIIHEVLHGVVIERSREDSAVEPVDVMAEALKAGGSLIVFPEGTRNTTDELLLPLKSGIYFLAQQCPQVEFVPVWMDNLGRLLPKGEIVPVPLLCSISFGTPLQLQPAEDKDSFIGRIRAALLATKESAQPGE